jgi:5-oxoprolinase (ATP-hydrolysing)
MTNTKLTDPEELERRYPVRVTELGIRAQSGGKGAYFGGDGMVREVEFLDTLQVTLLGQHRYFAPYGLEGGSRGKTAEHTLYSPDGQVTRLPGICAFEAKPNDRLRIETPGGGGFGTPSTEIS